VDLAVAEFTDGDREPIVEQPNRFFRTVGPVLLRRAAAR
jgi:hypothetical protein